MGKAITYFVMAAFLVSIASAIDSSIFSELPDKPDDFWLVQREVYESEYPDLCNLDERYFRQPDFYPTWERNMKKYENIDYGRWTIQGYGAYPADQFYLMSHAPKGATFTLCTFLHTAYSVETYQGMKLRPTDSEYWDIEITPDQLLLPPTSPEFKPGWARKIEIKITAKKDVPAGNYRMGFNIAEPDQETSKQYEWTMLSIPVKGEEEYAEKCVNNPDNRPKLDYEGCVKKFRERVNQYVTGGNWAIGRNTFSFGVDIEQDTTRENGFWNWLKKILGITE